MRVNEENTRLLNAVTQEWVLVEVRQAMFADEDGIEFHFDNGYILLMYTGSEGKVYFQLWFNAELLSIGDIKALANQKVAKPK